MADDEREKRLEEAEKKLEGLVCPGCGGEKPSARKQCDGCVSRALGVSAGPLRPQKLFMSQRDYDDIVTWSNGGNDT